MMIKGNRFLLIIIILLLICISYFLFVNKLIAEDILIEPKTVTIYGVLTENNVPLEGAMIWIESNPPINSDAAGYYVSQVFSSSASIRVRTASGIFIGEGKIEFQTDTQTLEVNFDFIPGEISGVITENGIPLEGAKVFIGKNKWIETDFEGKYLSSVLPGSVNISAYTPQGVFIGKQDIEIGENEGKIVNFNFVPATISGSISQEGVSLEGVKIIIGSNAPILSDNQGFYLSKVIPGLVSVKAIFPGGEPIRRKTINVIQGDSLILNFE